MAQKSPPHSPKAFHRAMRDIAGLNPFGETRIRAVWGGNALDENGQLKYYTVQETGFTEGFTVKFLDNGEATAFRTIEELEASAQGRPHIISGSSTPMYERVGDERWYVEWWVGPEHLAGMPSTGSRTAGESAWNATPGIGDFPRKGVWHQISRVANPDGSYRGLDFGVVQACKAFMAKMQRWNMLRPGEVDSREACEQVLRDFSPDPKQEAREADEASRYLTDYITTLTGIRTTVKENIV